MAWKPTQRAPACRASQAGKPRVVIVGGGFAGKTALRRLRRYGRFDVTLIDAKGYFEFTPANLRCIVEPQHAQHTILSHPDDVICGVVHAVHAEGEEGGRVELVDGRMLAFEYCIVATGSDYTTPIKPAAAIPGSKAQRMQQYNEAHARVAAASRVVVVGGGTVGVELAAEICGAFRGRKAVTIIASSDRLLPQLPPHASQHVTQWLKKRNVEIILNDVVTDWGDEASTTRQLTTRNGLRMQADAVFQCIGTRPCSDVLRAHAAHGMQTAQHDSGSTVRKPVPVFDTLQVRGPRMQKVFAVGDCTDTREEKTALAADLSACCAADNIIRYHKSQPLRPFPQAVCFDADRIPVLQVVSLHKRDGVYVFNDLVLAGWIAAIAKWIVERLQVAVARDNRVACFVWDVLETTLMWVSKHVIKPRQPHVSPHRVAPSSA